MTVRPRLIGRMSSSDRRLLQTGLPLVLASTVLWTLPVLGRHYLDDLQYARWALVMTVAVSAPIFDLGGSILVQSVGYAKSVPSGIAWRARLLAGAGAGGVTLLACLLASLVHTSASPTVGESQLRALLLVTGAAAIVRSAWTIQMALLQTAERFGLRAVGATIQATGQVGVCWFMLHAGEGVWALPVSLLASSLLALVFGLFNRKAATTHEAIGQPTNGSHSLAASRVVSAVAGMVASQGDRWVLAAIATPSMLAKYDFALRMAAVPVGLIVTLFQGVTSESADRRSGLERHKLLVTTVRQMAGVVICASVATMGGVLALWRADALSVDATVVLLTGAALLWMGTNAVTAAPTLTYLGAGRPWAELAYSVPCALSLMGGWLMATATDSPLVVPAVSGIAIIGWSLWFVRRSWRDQRL